jgi:hypothetical protein
MKHPEAKTSEPRIARLTRLRRHLLSLNKMWKTFMNGWWLNSFATGWEDVGSVSLGTTRPYHHLDSTILDNAQ